MKELFKTGKQKVSATDDFTNLQSQPGWSLLMKILDGNIKLLIEHIITKTNLEGEKATEEELDILRDRIYTYKKVMGTPEEMIKKFNQPEVEKPDPDPYD